MKQFILFCCLVFAWADSAVAHPWRRPVANRNFNAGFNAGVNAAAGHRANQNFNANFYGNRGVGANFRGGGGYGVNLNFGSGGYGACGVNAARALPRFSQVQDPYTGQVFTVRNW